MTSTHGSPIALTIAAHTGNLLGESSWGFWPDLRHILYRRNTRNAERQQQCGRARQQGSSRVRKVQALDSRRSAVPTLIQQRGGLREALPVPPYPAHPHEHHHGPTLPEQRAERHPSPGRIQHRQISHGSSQGLPGFCVRACWSQDRTRAAADLPRHRRSHSGGRATAPKGLGPGEAGPSEMGRS